MWKKFQRWRRGAILIVISFGLLMMDGPSRAQVASIKGPVAENLLSGRTIVIDPGHGGYDPGAIGRYSREADINLAIALKLRRWFQLAGARVVMTWSSPGQIPPHRKYRVHKRIQWINRTHGSVLVDIHCNAGMGAWGPQVFYWNETSSRLLADNVAQELWYFTHTHRSVTQINQFVLRHATMPAINVEVGFLSNHREERQLLDPQYQKALAWYIFTGTGRWFLKARWPIQLLKVPPPTEAVLFHRP